jgi:hypothetical protein
VARWWKNVPSWLATVSPPAMNSRNAMSRHSSSDSGPSLPDEIDEEADQQPAGLGAEPRVVGVQDVVRPGCKHVRLFKGQPEQLLEDRLRQRPAQLGDEIAALGRIDGGDQPLAPGSDGVGKRADRAGVEERRQQPAHAGVGVAVEFLRRQLARPEPLHRRQAGRVAAEHVRPLVGLADLLRAQDEPVPAVPRRPEHRRLRAQAVESQPGIGQHLLIVDDVDLADQCRGDVFRCCRRCHGS